MTHEAFETVELGQAETLIELIGELSEEAQEKMDPAVAPYVEFE
ncbi:MAG TPA: hypothetical protein VFD62_12830 [Pyrinomonadaceae bacterium]|nr:hypothetical protein [Pyrinomonadaceae bacterium]